MLFAEADRSSGIDVLDSLVQTDLKDDRRYAEALAHYDQAVALQPENAHARKGRGSYLGDRSVGHQDPGATTVALLLATAADTL